MEWVSIWMSGIKLRETYKKIVVILLLISVTFFSSGFGYVIVMNVGIYGMVSLVSLGVYR